MKGSIEKAYYLKQEELAVLLAMNRVQRLYGFRMDAGMDREELSRILFEMARKNILSVSENSILMEPDLSAALKDLAQAENILILTGTEEYPECCIYVGHVGQNVVFVHLVGQGGQMYCIESVEWTEACVKMREYGFLIPGVLEKMQTCSEEEEVDPEVQELARRLYGQEKEKIVQHKEVKCCLLQYSVLQAQKIRQLLIIGGGLEDYLVCSDKEQDLVYLYSEEKAVELLEEMMGGRL